LLGCLELDVKMDGARCINLDDKVNFRSCDINSKDEKYDEEM